MSSQKPTHDSDVERRNIDPLLGRRRLVDVRCEFAERARADAEAAEAKVAEAEARLQTARATMEQTEFALDADTLAAAKEAAHRAFRKADRMAEDRDAVEVAASTWLAQINRVNRAARAVRLQAERQRRTVAKLEEELRRLSQAASAARASADLAAEACVEAREALAAGEVALAAGEAAPVALEPKAPGPAASEPAAPEPAAPEPAAPEPAAQAAPEPTRPEPAAAEPQGQAAPEAAVLEPPAPRHRHAQRRHDDLAVPAEPEPPAPAVPTAERETVAPAPAAPGVDFVALAGPAPDDERPILTLGDPDPPAIVKLLAGNRATFGGLVGDLGSGGRANEAHWRILVSDFVDAVRATAIDAGYFDFPESDPFWGLFSNEQAREIARHLAALGYRYDGMTGFADGRLPGRRELSLAVGNAGLNPIRIRHWPERDEIAALFRLATLATDQLIVERAPSLSLADVTRLLGRRAEPLGDLWSEWDRVRALLLERR